MKEMNDKTKAIRKYGKYPIAGGILLLFWAGFITHQCVVHGGMTYHRTFWISWQQWIPMVIMLWCVGFSSLAFGIRRGLKEMILDAQLKSDQENKHKEHRTTE